MVLMLWDSMQKLAWVVRTDLPMQNIIANAIRNDPLSRSVVTRIPLATVVTVVVALTVIASVIVVLVVFIQGR